MRGRDRHRPPTANPTSVHVQRRDPVHTAIEALRPCVRAGANALERLRQNQRGVRGFDRPHTSSLVLRCLVTSLSSLLCLAHAPVASAAELGNRPTRVTRSDAAEHSAAPAPVASEEASPLTKAPESAASETPASGLDEKQARAVELFNLGSQYYVDAEYERALEAFLDAQTLYPSAEFQYNIGACYEQLERYEAASRAYKTYLRNVEDIRDRANVENKIRRMDSMAELARKGSEPAASTETVTTVPPPQSRPSKDPQKVGKAMVVIGAVTMSLAAAGTGSAVLILGAQARKNGRIIEEINEGENPQKLTLEAARGVDEAGRRAETLQFVIGGVGAALTIGAAVLLGTGAAKAKSRNQARRPGLAPYIGRGRAGLTLRGSF